MFAAKIKYNSELRDEINRSLSKLGGKIMLNKFYFIYINLILLVLSNQLFAQIAYECTIGQTENVAKDSLLIEVNIISTGDPFILGTSTFTIDDNNGALNTNKPDKNTDGPWDDGIDATNYNDITYVKQNNVYK